MNMGRPRISAEPIALIDSWLRKIRYGRDERVRARELVHVRLLHSQSVPVTKPEPWLEAAPPRTRSAGAACGQRLPCAKARSIPDTKPTREVRAGGVMPRG